MTDSVADFEFSWQNVAGNPTISSTTPRTLAGQIAERHLDTVPTLFVDGHVKSMRLTALAQTKVIGSDNVLTAFTIEDD